MKSRKPDKRHETSFDFAEKVGAALRLAVADAIEDHRRTGDPLAVWQDGRVVMLPPDQAISPQRETRPPSR